ncbi:Breast cancer anti-estrogen resistance protein 3 homolog-like Protein [Tribolium castaneum]|uniref:Breast cancer anti-estrogen resistance protein 3 homolog-like Protein n=1 Tax=Tribolium castaneum TaxID=7070 RepID=A0A139W8E3_TRICA|nr:Breast cancer anti-estrogen resistance protein 3 homolog-like Protein [Tribolium castaneum]
MGKSASKLKKRKETKLSWTQRFGSLPLRSKSRINKANNVSFSDSKNAKHIDITQWLKRMELGQYESLFQKFNGVEDLLEFSEADLKDLGVKISSHRAMIISSLTILRAKYHGNFRRQPSIRHSVAVDKTITIEETDKLSNLSSVYEPVQSKSLNNLIMVSILLSP